MVPASEQVKAVTGALLAGLTALGTALADGEGLTAGEWVGVAVALVATYTAVYRVPNTRPDPSRPRKDHRTYEGGYTPLDMLVYVLVIAFLAVLFVWAIKAIFGA